MAVKPANVELLDPIKLTPNPDNPRLIFRQQELDELEESINNQGILVPLTVYASKQNHYVLLDGERRWRCARKLGLNKVPVIIQPKPERVQNIMMMFAIHNARRDWDPLPTALKLQELERELQKARGKKLTEADLAAAASLSRGSVRRYRKILKIPKDIQKSLLRDLEDPTSQKALSVDQVLEATDATDLLKGAGIISEIEERPLLDSIIEKFKSGVVKSTVEPRKLGALARFVRKKSITVSRARNVVLKFSARPTMTIEDVTSQTIQSAERHRSLDRGLTAFEEKWLIEIEKNPILAVDFRDRIEEIIRRLRALL
ncbi:MAG: ParB/RepB/Spo0J family partition protein [Rhodospirillaceae bacterium]|nr:ParB/RepB/Spo0J family partition protein [Rhodospirillaceae bacterium]